MHIFHPFESIRNRLLFILTLVPCAVMLLFFAMTNTTITQNINTRIYDSFFLALEMRSDSLCEMLDTAYELTVDITYEGSPIADQLDEILIGCDIVTQSKNQSYIEKTLNTYIHSSPSIGQISLIDLDSKSVLITTELLSSADPDALLTPLTSWRRSIVHAPHQSLSPFKNNTVLSLLRPFNTILKERQFAVYIESSAHYLEDLLDPLYDVRDTAFYMDKALLDDQDTILCSSNEELLPTGTSFQALLENNLLQGYRTLRIDNDGWTLAGIVSNKYYNDIYISLYSKAGLLLITCLMLFILLALLIWRSVYSPIREFAQEIRTMRPSQFYTPHRNSTELNEFRTQFNQMRSDIRRLINQSEAEAKKNVELENRLLLSRISPHFLHNTLDNIKWLALQSGQTEVSEMLTALNELIYYNLGKQRLTTLGNELNAMNGYLFLQKRMRAFEYHQDIQLAKDTLLLPVPCYILQPLVENSLRHGWHENLILTASLTEDSSHVYIQIADNGCGMNSETLESLRAMAQGSSFCNDGGIGLQYVFRALQLMYGSSVHIDINSEPDIGTKVTIVINR